MDHFLGYLVLASVFFVLIFITIKFSIRATGSYLYFILIVCTLSLAGIAIYITVGPYAIFADATYYHDLANAILNWWGGNGDDPYGNLWQALMGKRGWPTVIASLYWLIGVQPFVVIALNILLLGITSVFIAASVALISPGFNPKWLFSIFFLMAPFWVVFGVSMGRESIYWLSTSMMVYSTILFLRGIIPQSITFFLIASVFMICFRPNLGIPQIYAFILPIFVYWAVKNYQPNLRKVIKSIGIFLLLVLSVFPAKELVTSGAAPVEQIRRVLSNGANSGFAPQTIVIDESSLFQPEQRQSSGNSLLDYGLNSIQTLPRGLFGPYVTEFSLEPSMLLAEANLAYWLFLVVLVVIGIFLNLQRAFGLVLSTISILIVAIISTLLTNYGILVRFRAIAVIVLMPYSYLVLEYLLSPVPRRKIGRNLRNT